MSLLRRAENAPEPEPCEPWTVRYTTELDNGIKFSWDWTYNWNPEDKLKAAGDMLLACKQAERAVHHNGVVYPPHRIRRITWELV